MDQLIKSQLLYQLSYRGNRLRPRLQAAAETDGEFSKLFPGCKRGFQLSLFADAPFARAHELHQVLYLRQRRQVPLDFRQRIRPAQVAPE